MSSAISLGDLDASKFPEAGAWENIHYDEGPGWVTKDVTKDFGSNNLKKNDNGFDNTKNLTAIINSQKGNAKWRLQFPAGEYWFQTECQLTNGNFQLVGEGKGKTILRFNEGDKGRTIQTGLLVGWESHGPLTQKTKLARSAKRRDKEITVQDAGSFTVGDYVQLESFTKENTVSI